VSLSGVVDRDEPRVGPLAALSESVGPVEADAIAGSEVAVGGLRDQLSVAEPN